MPRLHKETAKDMYVTRQTIPFTVLMPMGL